MLHLLSHEEAYVTFGQWKDTHQHPSPAHFPSYGKKLSLNFIMNKIHPIMLSMLCSIYYWKISTSTYKYKIPQRKQTHQKPCNINNTVTRLWQDHQYLNNGNINHPALASHWVSQGAKQKMRIRTAECHTCRTKEEIWLPITVYSITCNKEAKSWVITIIRY